MPNPKRRHSHQRTALRRTHYTTDMPEIQANRQVGEEPFVLRNHASPNGTYKGRLLPGFERKNRQR